MNRIHRIVFNRATGLRQVVSETARSRGAPRVVVAKAARCLLLVVLGMGAVMSAWSDGGQGGYGGMLWDTIDGPSVPFGGQGGTLSSPNGKMGSAVPDTGSAGGGGGGGVSLVTGRGGTGGPKTAITMIVDEQVVPVPNGGDSGAGGKGGDFSLRFPISEPTAAIIAMDGGKGEDALSEIIVPKSARGGGGGGEGGGGILLDLRSIPGYVIEVPVAAGRGGAGGAGSNRLRATPAGFGGFGGAGGIGLATAASAGRDYLLAVGSNGSVTGGRGGNGGSPGLSGTGSTWSGWGGSGGR
ncbi:MAG: hypothetical protein EOO24_08950, partial [Comamonadaceae bacterium]